MFERLMGLSGMTPDGLVRLMQRSEEVTVIDVNSRGSWTSARVPGAMHLDPVGYTAGDLPPDRNALLVFYCSNWMCRKAPNAALRAKKLGYTNVHVMAAGISGWVAADLPTESADEQAGPVNPRL
jgi:rhodanese-related sulfurtransferase